MKNGERPAAAVVPSPYDVERPRRSPRLDQAKRTWYFLRRNTLAIVGLGIVLFWIAVALYSPLYPAPYNGLQPYCSSAGVVGTASGCISVCTYYSTGTPPGAGCYPVPTGQPSIIAPTAGLVHGTLQLGPLPLGALTFDPGSPFFYSVMDGVVKGAPWSLGIAGAIVGSGAVIGLLLGSLAGYKGGVIDESIMRLTDIFLAIPGLFLVLVVLGVAGSALQTLQTKVEILIIAFVVTWWPLYTRIVRGQVLVTREQKYIESARASGAKTPRILMRHIVPNSMYPVFVQMSLDVGTIPLLLGVIIFLGYPLWPNYYFPEWGTIAAFGTLHAVEFLSQCSIVTTCTFPWWQMFFPGLVLFLFAIAVNFLSDGLRDALDPRLRR
jgi:peptide/nickel transport system permease protein